MTRPNEETIARVINPEAFTYLDATPPGKGPTYEQVWTVGSREAAREKARAILALFPDATRQAERIAELERALRDARDTIETLYSARGSECEGELSAWVGPIDAALASAQSSTTGASDE